jgi:unsaturated chondroitin disaccharide hydrolase
MEWDKVWTDLTGKIDFMAERTGDRSPHAAKDGRYDDMRLDWWTSGFWPGMLWLMYDMTKDTRYLSKAWAWDEKLEKRMITESNFHHDVGFQFLPTAVIKHKITDDLDSRRRGLQAANFLAGRFNIAGRFLRAWNQEKTGWAIIDSSMNLSLLLWAAEESQDPRFRHIAVAHADTVLEKFMRPDGTVCHIASFDPESGAFLEWIGGQGFSPTSAWSRGQAWALYGLANVYRYTREERFLQGARRVADYFLAALPDDGVPPWDFRAEPMEGEPKDTSAAAIASSGLIEIAKLVPAEESGKYREGAERILTALTQGYASFGTDSEAILREGTGHRPENQNINVGLIYGDYYYAEAVAKLAGWNRVVF